MIHYHVGYNMPGYMPDTEPWTTNSFESARQSLLDDLSRHLDEDYEQHDGQQLRDAQGRFMSFPRQDAIRDLQAVEPGTWGMIADDLSYWIVECNEEGPDHEEEE